MLNDLNRLTMLGGFTHAPNTGGGYRAPADFLFPFDLYPIQFYRDGRTSFRTEDYAADALNGTAYYVDASTGLDANNGLSSGAKKQSVAAAITAGNAGGVPYHILDTNAAGGIVPRAYGPFGSTGGAIPNQKCAIIADNVSYGTHDLLTYTSLGSGMYSASRSNVARVLDTRSTDEFGNFIELVRVGVDPAVDADPGVTGIWYNSGTTFKVKLADGATVSNSNTVALLLTQNLSLNSTSKDFYARGFKLYGGNLGAFYANGVAGNVIAEDVSALFSGGTGSSLMDGFRFLDVNGLAAVVKCEAMANAKDGFNWHRDAGGAPPGAMAALSINCLGRDNGRPNSLSNNSHTLHDDIPGIDFRGDYDSDYGADVHIVGSSQLWAIGTQSRFSKGDVSHAGGGLAPQQFRTEGTTKMWLEDTVAEATLAGSVALNAKDTSTIYKRRHTTVRGTEISDAGASITGF